MMDDLLHLWHQRMDPVLELQYVHGIRAYGRLQRAKYPPHFSIQTPTTAGISLSNSYQVHIPVMSVCSGCGIAEKGNERLARYFRLKYGSDFEWNCQSLCEIADDKRDFLAAQHPTVPWLVKDMKELSEDLVENRRSLDGIPRLFPINS